MSTRVPSSLLEARHIATEGEYRRHLEEHQCIDCTAPRWCPVLNELDFNADVALRQWIDARDGERVVA